MTIPSSESMRRFKNSKKLLGGVGIESAANIVAAASDIALVLDGKGVVKDIAFSGENIAREGVERWVGKPWVDTVTDECRTKIEALLDAAREKAVVQWRHVNHPSKDGPDIPVLYSAMQAGEKGPIIAVGRDLREVSALQQRLVEAQQAIERDFEKLRQAETRYRLLFQMSGEAVLIVDAASKKISDANPAAIGLFGDKVKKLVGRGLLDMIDAKDVAPVEQMLASARATGRGQDVACALKGGRSATVSASVFRQAGGASFLVRLQPLDAASPVREAGGVARILERSPEGFAVTDLDGKLLSVNAAFVTAAELASEKQAVGEPIDRWLGRPGVDAAVLFDTLREHGSVRLFATIIRGELGGVTEVELSAVAAPDADPPCVGFMIRDIGSRIGPSKPNGGGVPTNPERLSELVGRVPLKDIVRDTTDVIERLCIEAALEITGDNRASAAEMLGLSRQSFYVKLRRYGLGDLDSDAVV